jgi:hypothetical protein
LSGEGSELQVGKLSLVLWVENDMEARRQRVSQTAEVCNTCVVLARRDLAPLNPSCSCAVGQFFLRTSLLSRVVTG